jgi:hypothetical protein
LSQNLNDADDILSELRNQIKKIDADILACESSRTPVAEERLTLMKTRAALEEQLVMIMRENQGKSIIFIDS